MTAQCAPATVCRAFSKSGQAIPIDLPLRVGARCRANVVRLSLIPTITTRIGRNVLDGSVYDTK